MGHLEHISLGEAASTGSAEPEAHAPAQRRGGLEKHADGGLAQVPPTGALTGLLSLMARIGSTDAFPWTGLSVTQTTSHITSYAP